MAIVLGVNVIISELAGCLLELKVTLYWRDGVNLLDGRMLGGLGRQTMVVEIPYA